MVDPDKCGGVPWSGGGVHPAVLRGDVLLNTTTGTLTFAMKLKILNWLLIIALKVIAIRNWNFNVKKFKQKMGNLSVIRLYKESRQKKI